MKKELMLLFGIVLVVCSMVVYAVDETEDPDNLGEIISVSVDRIEPITISSDFLKARNFPVYVYLKGFTLGSLIMGDGAPESAPFFGDIDLRYFNVIPRGASANLISGITPVLPRGNKISIDPTRDISDLGKNIDLGYIIIPLRQTTVEKEIPEELVLNLTAMYGIDGTGEFGVFGAESLLLKPHADESTWLNSDDKSDSDFWAERGYLRLIEVGSNSAKVQLYDGSFRKVGTSMNLKKGKEVERSLPGGPTLLNNKVRFKLESTSTPQAIAILTTERNGVVQSNVRVTKDMLPYTGSSWKVYSVLQDAKKVVFIDNERNKVILEQTSNRNILGDPCLDMEEFVLDNEIEQYAESSDEKDKLILGCTAIGEYQDALRVSDIGSVDRSEANYNIAEVYRSLTAYQVAVNYYYNVDPSHERYSDVQGQIEFYETIISENAASIVLDGVVIFLERFEGNDETRSWFKAKVMDLSTDPPSQVEHPEKFYRNSKLKLGDETWVVDGISDDFISIKIKGLPSRNDELIIGRSILNEIYEITVEEINVEGMALISILPGSSRAYGSSDFTVTLPIEKRLIEWTPEQIDRKINKTHKTIEKLENVLDGLGKLITGWKATCFSVFLALTVKNSFVQDPSGRRLTVERWSEECTDMISNGEFVGTLDQCLEANSDTIEAEVIVAGDAMDDIRDYKKNSESGLGDLETRGNVVEIVDDDRLTEKYLDNLRKYSNVDTADSDQLIISKYTSEEDLRRTIDNWVEEYPPEKLEQIDSIIGADSDMHPGKKEIVIKTILGSKEGSVNGNDLFLGESEANRNFLEAKYGDNFESVSVVEAYTDSDGKIWGYVNREDVQLGAVQNTDREGDPIIHVGGRTFYKDSNDNLYLVDYVQSTSQYSTEYNVKAVQYTEDKKPWIFPYKGRRDGSGEQWDHVGDANYVRVYFDSNGNPNNYELWNVGSDGEIDLIENTGNNDDLIVVHRSQFNTNPEFNGLKSRIIHTYNGLDNRPPEGKTVTVQGDPYTASYVKSKLDQITPLNSCLYHMPANDCKLLYNVCDPVMCPSSRFDLGGKWRVDSVIETGIIGSLVLGWGQKEPFRDYFPICLSGIHAGLDNIKTGFEAYEDCLQKAKADGEYVGVCNEITSIYLCEMLWREALSISGTFGKFSSVIGEKILGDEWTDGGEYSRWTASWQALGDSTKYFTNVYGRSSFAAFSQRSSQEFGTAICKAAIQGKVPGGADFLSQLTEPTSPPQFTAWFSEIEYTSVEIGKSVYRIYYHVYAGRDRDIRYSVYLKDQLGNYKFVTDGENTFKPYKVLKKGDYADVSEVVTANSGFNEICVEIDGVTECGFGKVTSSFSMDHLNDLLVKSELGREGGNITSESQCVPENPRTTPNLYSLPTPSNYGLLETGIRRVCAGVDPDGPGDKWIKVGTCGTNEGGYALGECYLDSTSIQLNDVERQEEFLEDLNNKALLELYGDSVMDENQSNERITNITGGLDDGAFVESLIPKEGEIDYDLIKKKLGEIRDVITYSLVDEPKFVSHIIIGKIFAALSDRIIPRAAPEEEVEPTSFCEIEYEGNEYERTTSDYDEYSLPESDGRVSSMIYKFSNGNWLYRSGDDLLYTMVKDSDSIRNHITNQLRNLDPISEKSLSEGIKIIVEETYYDKDDFLRIIKEDGSLMEFGSGPISYLDVKKACDGEPWAYNCVIGYEEDDLFNKNNLVFKFDGEENAWYFRGEVSETLGWNIVSVENCDKQSLQHRSYGFWVSGADEGVTVACKSIARTAQTNFVKGVGILAKRANSYEDDRIIVYNFGNARYSPEHGEAIDDRILQSCSSDDVPDDDEGDSVSDFDEVIVEGFNFYMKLDGELLQGERTIPRGYEDLEFTAGYTSEGDKYIESYKIGIYRVDDNGEILYPEVEEIENVVLWWAGSSEEGVDFQPSIPANYMFRVIYYNVDDVDDGINVIEGDHIVMVDSMMFSVSDSEEVPIPEYEGADARIRDPENDYRFYMRIFEEDWWSDLTDGTRILPTEDVTFTVGYTSEDDKYIDSYEIGIYKITSQGEENYPTVSEIEDVFWGGSDEESIDFYSYGGGRYVIRVSYYSDDDLVNKVYEDSREFIATSDIDATDQIHSEDDMVRYVMTVADSYEIPRDYALALIHAESDFVHCCEGTNENRGRNCDADYSFTNCFWAKILTSYDGSSHGVAQINKVAHPGCYFQEQRGSNSICNIPVCEDTTANELACNLAAGFNLLRRNYNQYGDGRDYTCDEYTFENGDTEDSISEYYEEWDAALRGYNGWGCAGRRDDGSEIYADHDYVETVKDLRNGRYGSYGEF